VGAVQRTKELVEAAVTHCVEEWAKTLKLTRSDARFAQFREDVTEALRKCIERHILEQTPLYKMFARTAYTRRRLKDEAEEARALAKRLREFTSKYSHPTIVLRTFRQFDLLVPAEDLDELASFLEKLVGELKDKGGQLPKLQAFKVLAEGLIRAYGRATKQRGRGRSAREGKLLDFVEAVLPAAREIAKDVTGKPLQVPLGNNLGEQLNEIAGGL
jgi:hypothetical protein